LLRQSYSLIAPFYDLALDRATRAARRASIASLEPGKRVLLPGIGTGLDLPFLPSDREYVGIDLTHAMLARIPRQNQDLNLVQGDAMRLPFAEDCFDHVVMHLIVAVVPQPALALAEAARVLKPGGTLLVFDKFLLPGRAAPLRRLANVLVSQLATRLDVVFEDLLPQAPRLRLESDQPAAFSGWFRLLRLRKQ
jgi:phosphatidylethanolamine/phosphatidyl-N-methylethanolamine N-methyltransferase